MREPIATAGNTTQGPWSWQEGGEEKRHQEAVEPGVEHPYEIACREEPENIGVLLEAASRPAFAPE